VKLIANLITKADKVPLCTFLLRLSYAEAHTRTQGVCLKIDIYLCALTTNAVLKVYKI